YLQDLVEKDCKWLRGGIWFFGAMVLIAAGGATAARYVDDALATRLTVPTALLFGIGAVAVVWQLRERLMRVTWLLAGATPVVMVLASALVLPRVEVMLKPSPRLAAAAHKVFAEAGETLPVYMSEYSEDSLVFYMNLPHDEVLQTIGGEGPGIAKWLHETQGPAILVTTTRTLNSALEQVDASAIERIQILHRESIINYSAEGERKEVIVVLLGQDVETVDERR
ncbi:MAG: hypothetical protein MI741_12035, partial [Rhodospirillales bacterium]|nr:hypothetical protein [Rhodospirillales bacterium]